MAGLSDTPRSCCAQERTIALSSFSVFFRLQQMEGYEYRDNEHDITQSSGVTEIMSAFRIDKVEGNSEILVAARDICAGETIYREERPLMFCPCERLSQYTAPYKDNHVLPVAYSAYTQGLSKAEQLRLRKLFAVTPEWHSNQFHRQGSQFQVRCSLAPHGIRKFTQDELKEFVNVCNVVRLYGLEGNNCVCVYEYKCKFTHSCIPNCVGEYNGFHAIYRAISPIQCGEKLTMSAGPYNKEPTHVRRK